MAKILVFYQYFGTPKGSWSTRVYELTRRWVSAGHQVTVVTAPYEKSDITGTGFISRQEVDGIKLIVINTADSNRASFLKRAVNALRFALASCRIALREPCDVVIASSGPITVGIPALAAKWFRNRKMVFEIRDLWPQGAVELGKLRNPIAIKMAWWFEKLCYRNADMVVACSPGMESSVRSRYPRTNTLVISNASDVELFGSVTTAPFELDGEFKGRKTFVYAGSLGLMDHGHLLVDAMRKITDPKIHLLVIGEGAERHALETESRNTGLANISFLGLLPKNQVAGYLRNAVAALIVFKNLPVLQTSSPNKLFDAFAAGIPVIHNTTGWIKELTSKSGCGFAIGPDDSQGLAEAMQLLSQNADVRNQMASQSKALGRGTFNRDRLAEQYLGALVDLTNK